MKEFLLDQILSHKVDKLAKLCNAYLARIVFGLQNFQITEASEEKLQRSLKLVADAYNYNENNKKHPFSLEEAELLSTGLQNFQSICPTELLEMIDVSLDCYGSSRDTKDVERAVSIVRNLRGYGSETKHTPHILEKAVTIIKDSDR